MIINFNSIDLETYGTDVLTPYCFCVVYKKKTVVFYGLSCIKLGIDWIFKNCLNNTIFYAHNLNFDGNIILNFLNDKYNICFDGTILKRGDFYCLVLEGVNKKIIFKCSAKILPLPLEEIGHVFNIGVKKKINHSFANELTIDNFIFKNNVINYCKNDTILVERFLEKIHYSIKNFENLKNIYSISGLALNIFKKNFNIFNISLNNSVDFDNFFRPSYYGGRCEVFGNLKENETCLHFDFSGMYTNRLLEEFPHGEYELKEKCEINDNGFYFVDIFSNLELPILPYRNIENGKLLFPNGYFSGLYWGEELLLFVNNGGKILKVHYGIVFSKKDYIFKNFGEKCKELRNNSNHDKILWKLIPNSFIGRMGLRYDEEETLIIEDNEYDPRKFDVICDKKINKKWIVRVKKHDMVKKTGNVIYPAVITSKARILWWKSAKEVIRRGGRLMYCDTDSIFASFNKKKLPLNEHHGEVYWDSNKEDTVLDDACFVSSKIYGISYKNKNKIKIKGISRKDINDISLEDFKKLFFSENKKEFKTINFEKTKLNIKIVELKKLIDFSFYDKRIFNKDKTETKSLYIKIPYINKLQKNRNN